MESRGHTPRHFEWNPVFDMEQIKTSTANNWHVCGTFLSFILLTKPTAWVQYRIELTVPV
jgi:hypothetical protein